MGKTRRKQPDWMTDDDRWMKKGGKHFSKSRRSKKQDFEQEVSDVLKNDRFNY